MTDEPEASVLGSLPHSRPQRRSDRRGARPEQPAASASEPDPEPDPNPEPGPTRGPGSEPGPDPEHAVRRTGCVGSLGDGAEIAGTVVRATAELAEIGLTLAARALRSALSRLPRP
ncbi:MAG: hypothetical protein KGL15_05405 [Acidobacteriota bacterium]|nr:hypothetical protein [Acidobacteriota bacterium]